ncbi:MAG: hypothetical protein ACK4NR_01760 [Micavibrio sp.]
MKKISAFLMIALISGLAGFTAQAASDTEFGERFTNEEPQALKDMTPEEDQMWAAEMLNDISPASGEASAPSSEDNSDEAPASAPNTSSPAGPVPGMSWEEIYSPN